MVILTMVRKFVKEGEDPHTYVVGTWTFLKCAIEQGQIEYRNRGGKYDVIILETNFDGFVVKKYDHLGKPLNSFNESAKLEASVEEKASPNNGL